jgi:hypothetical protein
MGAILSVSDYEKKKDAYVETMTKVEKYEILARENKALHFSNPQRKGNNSHGEVKKNRLDYLVAVWLDSDRQISLGITSRLMNIVPYLFLATGYL